MFRGLANVALVILTLLSLAAKAPAATAPEAPLGIGLEGIVYPYPVHYLALSIQGQALRMAYMDVAPAGKPNGKAVVLFTAKVFAAPIG